MAVIHLANALQTIKNCSFAVVVNPPTGQSTTNYTPLQTICNDSPSDTAAIISIFDTRYDDRFKTQFIVIDGGTA